MLRFRFLLGFIMISSIIWLTPPTRAENNLDFQTKMLPNGIKLVYKNLPEVKTVTMRFSFPVGFINEPRRLRGISHLLEHLIYRGNAQYSFSAFRQQIENQGGIWNGDTGLDRTEYFCEVLPENFSNAFQTYLDMILHPSLDEHAIELEKKIVTVEKEMRTIPGDLFMFYLNSLTQDQLKDSVDNITRADLVSYHDQYYQLKNMTVIVTGSFDLKEVQKILQNQTSPDKPAVLAGASEWQLTLPEKDIEFNDYLYGEEYQLFYSFDLMKLSPKDLLVAKVLPFILIFGSRNFDDLNNRPLDYNIWFTNLADNYFLILNYRDCQNKYTDEINAWHQKNLIRYCKFLKTKNFNEFLNKFINFLDKHFNIISSDSMSYNYAIAMELFYPTAITSKDLSGIRGLTSGDFKNFTEKYLEKNTYHKIVVKAL